MPCNVSEKKNKNEIPPLRKTEWGNLPPKFEWGNSPTEWGKKHWIKNLNGFNYLVLVPQIILIFFRKIKCCKIAC